MSQHLYLEKFGPVHALPVLHYRLEFAQLVRMAFHQVKPDAVAIELPTTLEVLFLRAVRRLPQISVISYRAEAGKWSGQEQGETVYLLVEPADPLRYAASGAKRDGILKLPRRGLHIELPRAGRAEWREVYTTIIADFLAQAAALVPGR